MKKLNKKKSSYKLLKDNFDYITYSKNVFIPLTNFCRNNCKYCGFSKKPKRVMTPAEAKSLLKKAKSSSCSEALFTFGEKPHYSDEFIEKIKKLGYKDFSEYLKDIQAFSVKEGIIPHTNPGVVDESLISSIQPYNASMGLMLENITNLSVHIDSPGKKPSKRIGFLEMLGRKKIPTTTGLLIGIGETKESRIRSLYKIKEIDSKYNHIQEIIIQAYQPNEKSNLENKLEKNELYETISIARKIFPEKNIQSPPNLVNNPIKLIKSGINDLGGISDITPDYINPNHDWPDLNKLKKEINQKTPFSLKKRLPIYPEYVEEKWIPDNLQCILEEVISEEFMDDYKKRSH